METPTPQTPTATPAASAPGNGRPTLRRRQRRALEAICDTFAPGGGDVPSATELGVPAALMAAVAQNPRDAERKQVAQLLALWDTTLLTALGGGGVGRFSRLSQADRERVLLSWSDSRVPQRRAAFQALRKGTLLCYYGLPGPNGGRSPVWDALDYPGPLGPPADPPPRGITPVPISSDTELECDVCVVGSGAGGGVAAAVLAQAGLDVVVLEAGDYYSEADFDGDELSGFSRLYLNGGGMASDDQSIGLLAGACLGGGTVVNYGYSFRTPDHVRREWAEMGAPEVAGDGFDTHLDAVWERIGVNQEHNVPSSRDRLTTAALDKLGWDSRAMSRNVRGCKAEVCRLCHYGCQLGAKQSTLKTWLQDAADAGARIIVRTRARKVLQERGAASGVEASTIDGHRVMVRARAVVAAAGALHTPALLRRSGLANGNIGRHLRLHPVMVIWGMMDEEVRPWEGMLSGSYSDEHADLGDGYGVKYEHVATPPSILLSFSPWRGGERHSELMRALSHTAGVGVLLRDRDGGEVRIGKDGLPIVRWRLSDYDREHLRRGVEAAARITEAMGARRIYSSHAKMVSFDPGTSGSVETFMRDADACGWGAGQAQPVSFHIMGSARIGGSPESAACNPDGETWEVRNLVVGDGSAFPTASGVNPMVTIEALTRMNATALAERLA
jgi:choline dehydrogenase-like flavoprotein